MAVRDCNLGSLRNANHVCRPSTCYKGVWKKAKIYGRSKDPYQSYKKKAARTIKYLQIRFLDEEHTIGTYLSQKSCWGLLRGNNIHFEIHNTRIIFPDDGDILHDPAQLQLDAWQRQDQDAQAAGSQEEI